MNDHGDAALPPFPFGDLPDFPDPPHRAERDESFGTLPNWLASTGETPDGPNSVEESHPSLPYWPGAPVDLNETDSDAFPDAEEPRPDDTLANCPRPADEPPAKVEASSPTELIRPPSARRRPAFELPLPPPFSAGLSQLSPFFPAKTPAPAIADSQPIPPLERTPPPAAPLEIPPASAIWRTRCISVVPRIEESGTIAVFRTVIRDEAGRGFDSAKVAFPLPPGLKQVQASRKPVAKKGALNWNIGSLGATDSVPLSVKIPTEHLGGAEAAAAARYFEVTYRPLPGAKLHGQLASPDKVLVGEPFTISMTVSNTGELPSKAIAVRIVDRMSGGRSVAVTAEPIAPGQSRTIPVELISHVEGRHEWLATVESPGSETVETVFSTRGARGVLGLELRHDSMIRVDQDDEFALVVRNDSPVVARGVTAQLTVPEELTFASAPGGRYDRSLNLVGWAIGDIPAGESRSVVARLRGFSPGLVGIQARAESIAGTAATSTSNIFVEIDARATSSSLDKLLAALDESIPDDDGNDRAERPVEAGARHIVFDLAGSPYAVPIENVREVVRPSRSTPVPGMPDWMPGVANVRGDIVSIVDLPLFLGVQNATGEHRGLLIAQTDDRSLTVGLLVSNIVGIRRLSASRPLDREQFRNNPIAKFLDGIVEENGRLIPIVRFDALIRATELQTMQAAA